jgi:hypothetical protein
MNQDLENFKKIKQVEVPPFLFTRIQKRIEALNDAPFQWKVTFVAASVVLLILNISILSKSSEMKREDSLASIISAMHLSISNDLYDE